MGADRLGLGLKDGCYATDSANRTASEGELIITAPNSRPNVSIARQKMGARGRPGEPAPAGNGYLVDRFHEPIGSGGGRSLNPQTSS